MNFILLIFPAHGNPADLWWAQSTSVCWMATWTLCNDSSRVCHSFSNSLYSEGPQTSLQLFDVEIKLEIRMAFYAAPFCCKWLYTVGPQRKCSVSPTVPNKANFPLPLYFWKAECVYISFCWLLFLMLLPVPFSHCQILFYIPSFFQPFWGGGC